MKWIILLLGVVANASASVMVKVAMLPPYQFPSLSDPIAALKNWPFWLGLFLYGLAFLLYAAALARLPLNIAHPILTSGAIAVVAICSVIFFRESFTWQMLAGLFLITSGVLLITSTSR